MSHAAGIRIIVQSNYANSVTEATRKTIDLRC